MPPIAKAPPVRPRTRRGRPKRTGAMDGYLLTMRNNNNNNNAASFADEHATARLAELSAPTRGGTPFSLTTTRGGAQGATTRPAPQHTVQGHAFTESSSSSNNNKQRKSKRRLPAEPPTLAQGWQGSRIGKGHLPPVPKLKLGRTAAANRKPPPPPAPFSFLAPTVKSPTTKDEDDAGHATAPRGPMQDVDDAIPKRKKARTVPLPAFCAENSDNNNDTTEVQLPQGPPQNNGRAMAEAMEQETSCSSWKKGAYQAVGRVSQQVMGGIKNTYLTLATGATTPKSRGRRSSYGGRAGKKKGAKITVGASRTDTAWTPRAAASQQLKLDVRPVTRRETRGKQSNVNATIEIVDDDDDDEVEVEVESVVPRKSPPTQSRRIAVARIALGPDVFHENCTIQLKANGHVALKFEELPKRPTRHNLRSSTFHSVDLDLKTDLSQLKCYHAENGIAGNGKDPTAHGSFICFSIMACALEGIRRGFDNFFQGDFIVVEFESGDVAEFVFGLELLDYMRPYLLDCNLDGSHTKKFCKALLEDDRKAPASRKFAARPTPFAPKFLAGKEDDEVLLVYPFGCDKVQLDNAASDLNELNNFRVQPSLSQPSMDQDQPEEEVSVRNHYLTISAGDCQRLAPTEYLNDTLIDFWMRWISRNEEKASLHYFSTHFYSALCEKGAEGVQRWTARKGINIFEKTFIFVPVNKALHWSLAVVVNPGAILRHKKWLDDCELVDTDEDEDYSDQLYPCILFFDSLKAHNTNAVANNLRKWLNAEWKRTKAVGSNPVENPFTKKTMPDSSPRVPYQDNGWDCGVFVCRYAYAMTQLHFEGRRFSYAKLYVEQGRKANWSIMITENPLFIFSGDDIQRIRKEILALIEKLSGLYMPWDAERKRRAKEQKRAEKEETQTAQSSAAYGSESEYSAKDASDDMRANHRKQTSAAVQSTPLSQSSESVEVVGVKGSSSGYLSAADQVLTCTQDSERSSEAGVRVGAESTSDCADRQGSAKKKGSLSVHGGFLASDDGSSVKSSPIDGKEPEASFSLKPLSKPSKEKISKFFRPLKSSDELQLQQKKTIDVDREDEGSTCDSTRADGASKPDSSPQFDNRIDTSERFGSPTTDLADNLQCLHVAGSTPGTPAPPAMYTGGDEMEVDTRSDSEASRKVDTAKPVTGRAMDCDDDTESDHEVIDVDTEESPTTTRLQVPGGSVTTTDQEMPMQIPTSSAVVQTGKSSRALRSAGQTGAGSADTEPPSLEGNLDTSAPTESAAVFGPVEEGKQGPLTETQTSSENGHGSTDKVVRAQQPPATHVPDVSSDATSSAKSLANGNSPLLTEEDDGDEVEVLGVVTRIDHL